MMKKVIAAGALALLGATGVSAQTETAGLLGGVLEQTPDAQLSGLDSLVVQQALLIPEDPASGVQNTFLNAVFFARLQVEPAPLLVQDLANAIASDLNLGDLPQLDGLGDLAP